MHLLIQPRHSSALKVSVRPVHAAIPSNASRVHHWGLSVDEPFALSFQIRLKVDTKLLELSRILLCQRFRRNAWLANNVPKTVINLV